MCCQCMSMESCMLRNNRARYEPFQNADAGQCRLSRLAYYDDTWIPAAVWYVTRTSSAW